MSERTTIINWHSEQGTNAKYDFRLLDEDGSPVDVGADIQQVWFTAKLSPDDADNADTTIQKTLGNGIEPLELAGALRVSFEPTDTEALTAAVSRYTYNIKVKGAPNGEIGIPIKGLWRVYRSVTSATE